MKELAEADENLLYRLFGIDAELLMDHAWGRESATMQDIKSYRPKSNSVSSGQVLSEPYPFEKGKLIVKEMADLLTLELVERKAITDSITLYISYSGRTEHLRANGTITMPAATSSSRRIINYTMQLYERIAYRHEMLHRVVLTFNNITEEEFRQYDLFSSPEELEREHNIQKAVLEIKNRYGKNAVLKGMNLEEGAKTVERNRQIGGHKK